ncbi:MAG: type III pantothenate kinase [Verrucomicrobiae bacterium]|nr:type III pantothenate kinase [Verrucomicrobiae bacterium]
MHAEFLLVNNNNSRTKFALANGRTLDDSTHRVIDTKGLNPTAIAATLDGWTFDKIVLASVVPDAAEILRDSLGRSHPMVEVSHHIELGIAVDFPDPGTVGADRLANAAAVTAFHSAPAIVVDFGTAVTFDIVADGDTPAYVGGVIAPGLDVMRDYLHQRTALLPRIDLREPPAAIGKSTVDAMLSGAVHGYRGLVREILAQVREEMNAKTSPKIIATGGYADLIAAGLPEIDLVDPLLTLRGLAAIGTLNTF